MSGKVVQFLRAKDYVFVKNIGEGGTGKTVLLKDEIIDEEFVCKKYLPEEAYKEAYFQKFIEETKILHQLNHKNIVRVFNYYLYPEQKTGYILMEVVNGDNIYDYLDSNPHRINEIFVQVIDGFNHLEKNGVLHRDIRPDNILVSKEGIAKIIDFGFGKRTELEDDFEKSVSLNWRFSPPEEFSDKTYDFRTEVYFIGKLFEEIIHDGSLESFSYNDTLNKMVAHKPENRIESFEQINREVLSNETNNFKFSNEDRGTYQKFANELVSIFKMIDNDAEYATDIDIILLKLEEAHRNSILEEMVQKPNSIASCFVKGAYKYHIHAEMWLSTLNNFLKLFKSASIDKRKIILNNLWQRLDTIPRFDRQFDDNLPF